MSSIGGNDIYIYINKLVKMFKAKMKCHKTPKRKYLG